jgi:hypothetical protein
MNQFGTSILRVRDSHKSLWSTPTNTQEQTSEGISCFQEIEIIIKPKKPNCCNKGETFSAEVVLFFIFLAPNQRNEKTSCYLLHPPLVIADLLHL